MTGFIVTCEERSTIRNSSTCDTTMIYNVSEFVWPESPRDVQAKLLRPGLKIDRAISPNFSQYSSVSKFRFMVK